jgi:hypothetical protein
VNAVGKTKTTYTYVVLHKAFTLPLFFLDKRWEVLPHLQGIVPSITRVSSPPKVAVVSPLSASPNV